MGHAGVQSVLEVLN